MLSDATDRPDIEANIVYVAWEDKGPRTSGAELPQVHGVWTVSILLETAEQGANTEFRQPPFRIKKREKRVARDDHFTNEQLLQRLRRHKGKWSADPTEEYSALGSDIKLFTSDTLTFCETDFHPFAVFVGDDTDDLFPEFCEEDDYHLSNLHYNKMLTEDDIWSVFVDHYDFDTFI